MLILVAALSYFVRIKLFVAEHWDPKSGRRLWDFTSASIGVECGYLQAGVSTNYGGLWDFAFTRGVPAVVPREQPGNWRLLLWNGWAMQSVNVAIPLWHVISGLGGLLLIAAAGSWWLRRRRSGPPTCEVCGYDLRATPTRCPECGTRVGHAPALRRRLRGWRGLVVRVHRVGVGIGLLVVAAAVSSAFAETTLSFERRCPPPSFDLRNASDLNAGVRITPGVISAGGAICLRPVAERPSLRAKGVWPLRTLALIVLVPVALWRPRG